MKHRIAIFILVLFLAFSGLVSAQQVYDLPQVANGGFGGNTLRTTFVLFNNSDQQSVVTITLRNDAGSAFPVTIPGLGTNNVFVVMLAPGQTRFLETDGSGSAQAGSAQVVATSPVGVAAIFTIRGPAGQFLTESGIGASEALTEFTIAVDATGNFNTGLAVRNLESTPVTATLTLFDANGAQRGSPVALNLPANGHRAQFVRDDLFPALGNFRGKLTVSATGRLAALALRQNASPLSFTTLPVVDSNSGETQFLLPQVANGDGTIRTTFVIFNLSDSQTANVLLRLTNDNGAAFPVNLSNGQQGSQFNLMVPPDGALFLDTDAMGPVTAGAARVTSDIPVGVAGVFTILGAGGQFLTETGVGASPEVTAATIPVDLTGNFNTGLALFNNNAQTATVNLRFIPAGGGAAEVQTLEIEPMGATGSVSLASLRHTASFVPQLIPGTTGMTGSVAIESTVPVSALTLRQNSSPLSFTTLPVSEGVFGGGGGSQGSRALPATVSGVAVTSNRVLDQTLPGGFQLSGTVTLPGSFDQGLGVSAIRSDNQVFGGAVNPFTRQYRIYLPAGVYTVRFGYFLLPAFPTASGVGSEGSFVTAIHDFPGVSVPADTVRNFTIPAPTRRMISGRVSNLAVLPPELLQAGASLVFSPNNTVTAGIAGLDPAGDYSIELADGTYSVGLLVSNQSSPAGQSQPQGAPALQQAASLFLANLTVTGDNSAANFSVPAVIRLSGTISQPQTPQIPDGAGVSAIDTTFQPGPAAFVFFGTGFSFGDAATNGAYATTLVRNRRYDVSASLPVIGIGTPEEGIMTMPVPLAGAGEQFAADTVRNFAFPALPARFTLSGRVMGPEGPLSGVDVTVSSSSLTGTPNVMFTASTTTNAQGNYSFTVLSGTNYRVTFTPDNGLGAGPAGGADQ